MPNPRLFWKLVITADKETFHFILFQRTDVNPREAWVSGSERSGKFEKKNQQTESRNYRTRENRKQIDNIKVILCYVSAIN